MNKKITFATTMKMRLKGLLFADVFEGWLFLCPCNDVHTFGMRFPLDIVFIDNEGMVRAVYQNVDGARRLKCHGAVAAMERMSCDDELFQVGDYVTIGCREKEVSL